MCRQKPNSAGHPKPASGGKNSISTVWFAPTCWILCGVPTGLLEPPFATGSAVNVLLQLAVSLRAHGRGGMMVVVPAGSGAWKESVLQPITYSVVPAFSGLADLMDKDDRSKPSRRWEDALGRGVDGIAGLTAVDGATLITADYKLLAFGAKSLVLAPMLFDIFND